MIELDIASVFLGAASVASNIWMIRLLGIKQTALRLIVFSLITDIVAGLSTVYTGSLNLLKSPPDKDIKFFFFPHIPAWIFADVFQKAVCLDFAMDRVLSFSFPLIYTSLSQVSTSWTSFSCMAVACLLSTFFLVFEVEKITGFSGFDGSFSSFFHKVYFNFYINVLQWMATLGVLLCILRAVIAFIRYHKKGRFEQRRPFKYLLFPTTVTCFLRCTAIAIANLVPSLFIADAELQLYASRLISTTILLLIQPICLFLVLKALTKSKESEKAKASVKRSSVNRKKPSCAAAAVLAPALVIDATALSIWSTPMINLSITTKEFMEERANRERSVSFYQIVRHNTVDSFGPMHAYKENNPFSLD